MIPDKVLNQHIAILGKTGSGKTYLAKGIAEHLLRQNKRVCIIDPTSVWFGLRSDATGEKAAFPIVVFGGEHADVPLGRDHGAAIAEIVGTTDTSAVLDTRLMTVSDRTQFFTDFGEALLRKNKGPLHLIVDEAHLFAPQGRVNDPQSGKMLRAANNLVSLGRGVGLRMMLITQRPAKLHKDSLTQAETLIAMRLIAPQDRNAVEDWIGEWADPKQGAELLKSLPSLPTGEGWVWSPEAGILERQKFPRISTYDSSRAPDGDVGKIVLANIDLPTIQARLEAVAHDAFENDPKRLRAKLHEVQRELIAAQKNAPAAPKAEIQRVEVPVLKDAQVAKLEAAAEKAKSAGESALSIWREMTDALRSIKSMPTAPAPRHMPAAAPTPPHAIAPSNGNGHNGEKIAPGLRRMMVALAQRPNGLSDRQIGVRATISSKSGTFDTYLSRARSNGWLDGSRNHLRITQAGIDALGSFTPLPDGPDLLSHWLNNLSGGARRMLDALAQSGRPMTAEELGSAANISSVSGTFDTYLSRLRSLELISGDRSALQASEELF